VLLKYIQIHRITEHHWLKIALLLLCLGGVLVHLLVHVDERAVLDFVVIRLQFVLYLLNQQLVFDLLHTFLEPLLLILVDY
jgi:hypothetical protein